MEQKIVGLIAAMPDEIRPLLKQLGHYDKSVLDGFSLYRFGVPGKRCALIESGIGMKRAERATRALIASIRPEALISFGFGGAVRPGMAVGDMAVAGRSFLYSGGVANMEEAINLPTALKARQALENVCRKFGCKVLQADFLSSDTILIKKILSETLPPAVENPVLDMETWAVARSAAREKVPLIAVRAVSDAACEELDFSLDQFTDSEMNIRISRILGTIARKPRIIPQLIRLAGNSRIAGRNLGAAVKELLETV